MRPYMTEILLMGRKESNQTNIRTVFVYAKSLLDKHLNMEDILEKSLKIKATLKFAGNTMKLKEIKLS